MKTTLDSEHLEDLRRSGLSDETIEKANIRSVTPADIQQKLGFIIPGVTSGYEIPYPGTEFSRFKVFYAQQAAGRKPKYLQGRGSGNKLYVPYQVEAHLGNSSIPLYITEGEKKALKAAQEGLCCIGLSGLWNWSDGKKRLLSDFKLISLQGRTVFIVPDNDWQSSNKHGYKKNLTQAVEGLAQRLGRRGAKVSVILLPEREAA